jgi:CBS-domain-containing membrane protein
MVRKLAYTVSEREHWISGVGGTFGIFLVWWVSNLVLDDMGAILVASSMGSTAVLLFAAPHGALSQPWAVFGGHLVSALIGVTCMQWLGHDPMLAASIAVGLSIIAMYSLRCLHPPGGATALAAVLGGETVHALGYAFVWSPVMLNTLIMLGVAIAYNYPFAWRRYPQAWARHSAPKSEKAMIPHSRLVYALSQIDTFVDVSEEDLQRIYELAMHGEVPATQAADNLAAQSTRA